MTPVLCRSALAAICAAVLVGSAAGAENPSCERWRQRYPESDDSTCTSFDYSTGSCLTERAQLREQLVRHCRAHKPTLRPAANETASITVIIPSANRPIDTVRPTLDALVADLPECTADGPVQVAVYNTGNETHDAFFAAAASGAFPPCVSFIRWFHAYEQPFPEVPYIAEEGPDWESRRDIPAAEQVGQAFDYVSVLRDAFWFRPSIAYLLLEDDFATCSGALPEAARVVALLEDGEPTWAGAQLSYGGSGWLLARGYMRQLAQYIEQNAYHRPVDLLMHMYFGMMRRPVFAADAVLFEHIGDVSTFHGREHTTFPRCGETNSALHFRSAFAKCPYEELSQYLCDWPHAALVYAENGPVQTGAGADGSMQAPQPAFMPPSPMGTAWDQAHAGQQAAWAQAQAQAQMHAQAQAHAAQMAELMRQRQAAAREEGAGGAAAEKPSAYKGKQQQQRQAEGAGADPERAADEARVAAAAAAEAARDAAAHNAHVRQQQMQAAYHQQQQQLAFQQQQQQQQHAMQMRAQQMQHGGQGQWGGPPPGPHPALLQQQQAAMAAGGGAGAGWGAGMPPSAAGQGGANPYAYDPTAALHAARAAQAQAHAHAQAQAQAHAQAQAQGVHMPHGFHFRARDDAGAGSEQRPAAGAGGKQGA